MMARIPESEIERLKSEIAVERLVEASGIALKKSDKDQQGWAKRSVPTRTSVRDNVASKEHEGVRT